CSGSLHGYDLAKLSGAIQVRRGRRGEGLTLLDERDVEVDDDVLVIADDSGAIGLAGIMGGAGTAVSAATVDVLFEGAFFARDVIAGRARRFGLHTDASLRFERGVDPWQQGRAVNRAVELLTAIAGGRAGPLSHVLSEAELPARAPVDLRWRALDARLGCQLDRDRVCAILERLQMRLERDGEGIRATPPGYRFDIEIADDLVEEVARIHGYDEIPAVTATSAAPLPPNREGTRSAHTLRATLVERGYQEIVSYSFVEPQWQRAIVGEGEDLGLSNPISSDLAVMRRSLLPGLLKALADNQARQQSRLRLFEIGHCFEPERESGRIAAVAVGDALPEQWGEPPRAVDFFDIKTDLLRLFGAAAPRLAFVPAPAHPALHPGRSASLILDETTVGVLGVMHPGLTKSLEIGGRPVLFEADLEPVLAAEIPVFQPVSRFPAVRRDLAVLVPEDTPAGAVVAAVRQAIPDLLQQVHVFDIYRGEGIEAGLKSVALGLILQETSRTLTDEDSDQAVHSAVAALTHELGARLRDQ
ncbi:MAG: phenylalanine--tRNA ligase subunit beta, partial [Pseudomonadota bacterium]